MIVYSVWRDLIKPTIFAYIIACAILAEIAAAYYLYANYSSALDLFASAQNLHWLAIVLCVRMIRVKEVRLFRLSEMGVGQVVLLNSNLDLLENPESEGGQFEQLIEQLALIETCIDQTMLLIVSEWIR